MGHGRGKGGRKLPLQKCDLFQVWHEAQAQFEDISESIIVTVATTFLGRRRHGLWVVPEPRKRGMTRRVSIGFNCCCRGTVSHGSRSRKTKNMRNK